MELYLRFILQVFSPAGFQGKPAPDESVINGYKALDIMMIGILQLF
jgi:hypothetical protein